VAHGAPLSRSIRSTASRPGCSTNPVRW
jgi:hypothetical protein